MRTKLLAAGLVLATGGLAHAQDARMPNTMIVCPDGSDPLISGSCTPVQLRNAIDEGRASSRLPPSPPVVVPNDPLGKSIGGGDLGIGQMSGFGNRAMQLPKIK